MDLKPGFHAVPEGHLASVVTHLEMLAPAAPRPEHGAETLRLDLVRSPSVDWYRALFRTVGADWLWFSRLDLAEEELEAVLSDLLVEVHVLRDGSAEAGLLELDFRQPGQCELAYFGLAPALVGTGAGRFLMNRALELAWRGDVRRFHVHTCTLDHPGALPFYLRSGFSAYRREVEVAPDPRLQGVLPRGAARHVPLICERTVSGASGDG